MLNNESITLSQVIEELQSADAIIVDGTVLYGRIEQSPPSLFFSWEEEGQEFEVEVDEDNFVSAEVISSTELKVTYDEDDYVLISALVKAEFDFG